MGGMYVANDFQRLMTRKEVEICEEGRRRANDEGKEKEEEKKRGKKLEPREHEAFLNIQTAAEVIN